MPDARPAAPAPSGYGSAPAATKRFVQLRPQDIAAGKRPASSGIQKLDLEGRLVPVFGSLLGSDVLGAAPVLQVPAHRVDDPLRARVAQGLAVVGIDRHRLQVPRDELGQRFRQGAGFYMVGTKRE